MSTICFVCHRRLTDPDSIAAGVGPICAGRAARKGITGGFTAAQVNAAERRVAAAPKPRAPQAGRRAKPEPGSATPRSRPAPKAQERFEFMGPRGPKEGRAVETMDSCVQWARDTFGEAPATDRVLARAAEEVAEMLRALTSNQPKARVAEEAADAAIILFRAIFNLRGAVAVRQAPVPSYDSPKAVAIEAYQALGRAMAAEEHDDPSLALFEAILTFRVLETLIWQMGSSPQREIDTKMAINRKRRWQATTDGHGYHIREGSEAAARTAEHQPQGE